MAMKKITDDEMSDRQKQYKQLIEVAESSDAKYEAYKGASALIAVDVASGVTQKIVATIIGKAPSYVQKLLAWRKAGHPQPGPWSYKENQAAKATQRKATSHARKAIREQPKTVVKEIAAALENPEVAKAVASVASFKSRHEQDKAAKEVRAAEVAPKKPLSPAKKKANEARAAASMAKLNKFMSNVMSPAIYIDSAIEVMEQIEGMGEHLTQANLTDSLKSFRKLGEMLWTHGALQGWDVSEISRAIEKLDDQLGKDDE